MIINYIYHSGFLIELDDKCLVFDYYKGEIPSYNKNKKTYIFSSHSHSDHFNKEIFNIFKDQTFILSSDILQSSKYIQVSKDNEYKIDDIYIKTLGSTDLGVAFLIKVNKLTIFYAGDLHLWHFDDDTLEEYKQMYDAYLKEINKLKGEVIDYAFIVVDSRLNEFTFEGLELFDKLINPKAIIPMHMQDDYKILDNYKLDKLIKINKELQIIEKEEKL